MAASDCDTNIQQYQIIETARSPSYLDFGIDLPYRQPSLDAPHGAC